MDIKQVVSYSKHSLFKTAQDYTSLEDILLEINLFKEDNFYLTQSAEVAEHFLRKRFPSAFFTAAFSRTRDSRFSHKSSDDVPPSVMRRLTEGSYEMPSSSGSLCTSGRTTSIVSTPRQITTTPTNNNIKKEWKIILVDRELEESELALVKLKNRFISAKFLLGAEENNFRADLEEIEKITESLNRMPIDNIVRQVGFVRKDKFERYLESELEIKERELKRLRLNVINLQSEYTRIKSQQLIKLELTANIHNVDIDKLVIESQHKQGILNEKIMKLHDMKKENAYKGSSIISVKLKLDNTVLDLEKTMQETKNKKAKCAILESIETQNSIGLKAAEKGLDQIKKKYANLKIPNVQSYIELEVALSKLKKESCNLRKRLYNDNYTITLLKDQLRQTMSCSESPKLGRFKSKHK